jgi:hypothetical protein
MSEVAVYLGRLREFRALDWAVYVAWVGLMAGVAAASGAFIGVGYAHGVRFPVEAWLVPIGATVFTLAIAVDTIGHRTVYRDAIRGAEGLVHHVTIAAGVGSGVLLCAAYAHRQALWIPALVLTALSFVYSLVDEAFHWRRYLHGASDRVEMWSHAFILIGHGTMMAAWWRWLWLGYPGVADTIDLLAR